MFISTISETARANRALCFSNVVSSWDKDNFSIQGNNESRTIHFPFFVIIFANGKLAGLNNQIFVNVCEI